MQRRKKVCRTGRLVGIARIELQLLKNSGPEKSVTPSGSRLLGNYYFGNLTFRIADDSRTGLVCDHKGLTDTDLSRSRGNFIPRAKIAYFSFAYSALASFRIGMSVSASFQSVKNS
jgi:hypothetical protein